MSKRSDEELQAEHRGRYWSWGLWSVGIVVALVLFIILAKLVSGGTDSDSGTGDVLAPSSLVAKVTGLPTMLFESVGQGSANNLPKLISAPVLTKDNKPHIVYMGSEYCPYCATERWPLVIALSRFGSFTGLKTTHSSSTDAYPSTQTFSFHGSTYTSDYLAFTAVEMQTNQPNGSGGYKALDTPTAEEQSILNTYDAAPYVAANAAGSIPFIDFGGRFVLSGTNYSPSVLQGKSADDIASALSDTKSDISQGAVGSANVLTATMCALTGDKPVNVCSTSLIQGLEKKIKGQ